jgi:hypothetical protein
MHWLVLLLIVALLLLYVLIIRPILKQQPTLSAAFKAEASLWQQLQAKLTGFRIGQAIKKPKWRPFGLDKGLYFCGRCEKQVHHVDWEKLCESCAGGTYFVRK